MRQAFLCAAQVLNAGVEMGELVNLYHSLFVIRGNP
jgi:hypothetical protein